MNRNNSSAAPLLFIILLVMGTACNSLRPISSSNTSRKGTTEHTLRKDITRFAVRQEGAKYKYGARGPRHFDCSGLTCYIYKEYGIELPGGSYNQARLGRKISTRQARPGDLVFFGRSGKVNHVAVVLKNSSNGLEVIHSTSSRGVIRENVSKSTYWKKRILFVRDVIEG